MCPVSVDVARLDDLTWAGQFVEPHKPVMVRPGVLLRGGGRAVVSVMFALRIDLRKTGGQRIERGTGRFRRRLYLSPSQSSCRIGPGKRHVPETPEAPDCLSHHGDSGGPRRRLRLQPASTQMKRHYAAMLFPCGWMASGHAVMLHDADLDAVLCRSSAAGHPADYEQDRWLLEESCRQESAQE